jgi:hypothetical protein
LCEALLARCAVLVEQARELEIRLVVRQTRDLEADDLAPRESALNPTDVLLNAEDHHVLDRLAAAHLHATCECPVCSAT